MIPLLIGYVETQDESKSHDLALPVRLCKYVCVYTIKLCNYHTYVATYSSLKCISTLSI